MTSKEHVAYVLRLADNALILGQRLSEWCGHGPILEEDISLTNIALDLVGQARLLYTHAGRLEGRNRSEDDFAFWRNEGEFRNWTVTELPNAATGCGTVRQDRDYAVTIVRNFLYSALMVEVWQALEHSTDRELAAIAAKSVKEARYHLRHARDWTIRFGDGTEESHRRAQGALDQLLPYFNEVFNDDAVEQTVASAGIGVLPSSLRNGWLNALRETLQEATLELSSDASESAAFVSSGKHGIHSEHMGFLLAEMQGLPRQHPGATW